MRLIIACKACGAEAHIGATDGYFERNGEANPFCSARFFATCEECESNAVQAPSSKRTPPDDNRSEALGSPRDEQTDLVSTREAKQTPYDIAMEDFRKLGELVVRNYENGNKFLEDD